MRIATWNIKQIAPRKPLDDRLSWLERNVAPDIAVLTEADLRVPATRPQWSLTGQRTAIGRGQNFSTFNVSSKYTLKPIHSVKTGRKTYELDTWYPGILTAADVEISGRTWGTLIGMYGITRDPDGTKIGAGFNSVEHLLDDIDKIVASGRKNIIAAGDLNLLPTHVAGAFEDVGLVDLLFQTSIERDPLRGCTGCDLGSECGHLWTHKNGNANGNGVPQQLDYIFCSEDLFDSLETVWGGVHEFDDVLDYSDHAPVVADFSL